MSKYGILHLNNILSFFYFFSFHLHNYFHSCDLKIYFSVTCGTFQKEFKITNSVEERNVSITLNCEDVYGHSIFINEVKFERQRSRRDDLKQLFGERCNNRTTCAIEIGHPDWSIFVYYKCKFVSSL